MAGECGPEWLIGRGWPRLAGAGRGLSHLGITPGVDPSKILPKWGRWSSRERQLREIAENKRVH